LGANQFIEVLLEAVVEAASPFTAALQDEAALRVLTSDLAWPPPGQSPSTSVLTTLQPIGDAIKIAAGALDKYREEGQEPDALEMVISAVGNITRVLQAVKKPSGNLVEPFDNAMFWEKLAGDLSSFLMATYMRQQVPALYLTLRLAGVIAVTVASGDDGRVPGATYTSIRWDRLGLLFTNPKELASAAYGWGGTLDGTGLLRAFLSAGQALGLPAVVVDAGAEVGGSLGITDSEEVPPLTRVPLFAVEVVVQEDPREQISAAGEVGFQVMAVPEPGSTELKGIFFGPYAAGRSMTATPLTDDLTLEISGGMDIGTALGIVLVPGDLRLVSDPDAVLGDLALSATYAPKTAAVLAGDPSTMGVSAESITLGLLAAVSAIAVDEVVVRFSVLKLRISIDLGSSDGFLKQMMAGKPVSAVVDVLVEWSSKHGLRLAGTLGLQHTFATHLSLGPFTISAITISGGIPRGGKGLRLSGTAAVNFLLGPVTAAVDQIGLAIDMIPDPDGWALGMTPSLTFISPNGIGLAVQASKVAGGGFVGFDYEQGRYTGALHLDIAEVVSVTAIGLIVTRLPDGSEGFSLLVILTAAFPPVNLGFGFTLSGLGGLLGLNRTMNVQALRDGVRSGVLKSILFPVDPVARATKVISDVESVFPVAAGRFTIGFMARLGWGSPQFLTADLGIILELPMPLRVAIIGRLGIVLPDKEAAVVVLKLDVVGILDLGRQEISIDATLYESRVAAFEISGDMAVRIAWGGDPVFAVSVGGFNPRFVPPPGFPQLRRMTIALATSENPRIRLESYFAVTSNTLQIGARLDAHAHQDFGVVGTFSVDAYLGFDALIIIRPFQFIVDLSGGIVIKRNGSPFLGAELVLTLYGPQPLRAVGYAEVHFLGTHRIPFKAAVGPPAPEVSIAAVDPLEELRKVLARAESWSALPPTTAPGVSVTAEQSDTLLAHPMGSLAVRQRVVPLGITIDRFGGAPLEGGPRSYSVTYTVGAVEAKACTEMRDAWAPGDLFNLSDEDKVSRPSFQQLISGHGRIADPAAGFGPPRLGAAEEYETRVIDEEDRLPRRVSAYPVPVRIQTLLGAVAAAGLVSGKGYSGPQMAVALSDYSYVVASTEDLTAAGPLRPSWVEAFQAGDGASGRQIVAGYEVKP
jgi:hypothetical protein